MELETTGRKSPIVFNSFNSPPIVSFPQFVSRFYARKMKQLAVETVLILQTANKVLLNLKKFKNINLRDSFDAIFLFVEFLKIFFELFPTI